MAAHHDEARQGVHAVIAALSFTGLTPGGNPLPTGQIIQKEAPTIHGVAPPCIEVCNSPGQVLEEDGTNASDDWGYPIPVVFIAPGGNSLEPSGAFANWAELVKRALHNKKPAALVSALTTTLKWCKVEAGPVLDANLFLTANVKWSTLLVRVWTRELR